MANSAIVGLLRALLVADTASFDKAMQRSGDAAKTWSKEFKKVGREMTAVGETLTKTVTLPLVALGAASAKLAIDFESSFAGVRKTVDASAAEFAALEKEFRQLAKTIPINVNEINKLGEAAGALGIPKKEISKFVEVMAGLGVATNLTAEQAADSIARIQNIYGAAGKDTDRFASTLVALGNAGASTEKQIVEMATRIAGAGKMVGVTQAQTLAFASTLASVGIEAEAGGSAISRIFLKINDAVIKGGPALDGFARAAKMSAADFKTAFETDAAGAVEKFISGIGSLGKNANPVIESLIGKNIILKNTIMAVGGAGDLLKDQLALATDEWKKNEALTKETGERYKTVASQMTILWNKIQDVGITLGQALLPVIQKLIDLFGGLVPILEGAVKFFAALPEPIQIGAVAFLGLLAAAGPLLLLFGQLAFAASTLTGAFAAQGIATQGLAVAQTALGISSTALKASLPLLGTALFGVGAALAYAFSETSRLRKEQGEWAAEMAERNQLVAAATKVFGEAAASQIDFSKWTRAQRDDLLQAGAAIKGTTVTLSGLNDQFGLTVTKGGAAATTVASIPPELDETSKAAKAAAAALEKAGRAMSEAGIVDQMKELAAQVAVANKHGGVAKEKWQDLTEQIDKWVMAGKPVPQILRDFRMAHIDLVAYGQIPVINKTQELIGQQTTLVDAMRATGDAYAGLAVIQQKWSNMLADPRSMNAIFKILKDNAVEMSKPPPPTFWETYAAQVGAAFTGPNGLFADMTSGFTDVFANWIGGAESFSDGFEKIWRGLFATVVNIWKDLLNTFINQFLKGMIGALMGQQGAWGKAFGGMITSFGGTAATTAAGTAGTAATSAGAGAAGTGAAAGGTSALAMVAGPVAGAGVGYAVGNYVGYRTGSRTKGALAGAGAGAATGATVGSFAGPVGTVVGGVVGGVVGAAAGWYGAVKAGKDINDMRDAFAESLGGMDAIETRLRELNRFDLFAPFAFGERNIDSFKEALGNVQEVFIAADKKAAEFKAGMERLGGALTAFGGYAPAEIRKLVAPLLQSKDLTAEMRSNLEGFAADPSWQTLETRAKDLGVNLAALGPKFNEARISDIALGYVRDLKMFEDAGADVVGVLDGMQDELSTLWQDAQKTGQKLPESLRPYMQRLVEMGKLVDENGKKVEVLTDDMFKEVEDKGLKDVVDVLKEIKDLLAKQLPKAAEDGAKDVSDAYRRNPVVIPVRWGGPGPAPTPPGAATERGAGDETPPPPEMGLWGGTHGQYVDWGAGTAVTLHGKERVVPEGEIGGGDGTPIVITVISTLDGREVARNQVRHIPRALQLAGL